ncbi:MAG: hypothetical protein V3U20_01710 [Thermoplasmata archaeon]
MHKTVEISVEENLFEANSEIAAKDAELLKKNNIYSIDFLGSIGSGKTHLLEKILDKLKERGKRSAAIAGDDDYKLFKEPKLGFLGIWRVYSGKFEEKSEYFRR